MDEDGTGKSIEDGKLELWLMKSLKSCLDDDWIFFEKLKLVLIFELDLLKFSSFILKSKHIYNYFYK